MSNCDRHPRNVHAALLSVSDAEEFGWERPTSSPAPGSLSPNPDTFLRSYLENERRIHAYIVSVMGNLADADDVLQETVLVLWQKFGQFEAGTDFLAWACRIAQFRALKHLEKRKQSRRIFRPEVLDAVQREVLQAGPQLDARHQALVRCVDRLPPRDRDLLRLRYAEGFSPRKIAAQAGRSVDGIYKSLARIREGLMACIQRRLAGGSAHEL